MLTNRSRVLLAGIALLGAVPAQSFGVLVGGADQAGTPVIQRQTICNPPAVLCSPALGLPVNPAAGGSAYDPIRQVVFDTDGLRLFSVWYGTTGGACRVMCPPMPVPGIPATAAASGLAFEEDSTSAGALWCVDTGHGLQRFTWQTRSCPGPGPRCSIAAFMPTPAHVAGGLAISETNRTIFWSASDFVSGAANNWVFAAPLANPCQPTCRLQVQGCGALALGPITGLAFDDCTDCLYLTDGRLVMVARYTPPGGGLPCQLQLQTCCTAPAGRWYGLCLEPIHPKTVGTSCLGAPCPACPSMALAANGDPVLGNAAFGFLLSGAPPNVPAVCLVGLGPCTAGLPFLCGMLHLPLAPPPVSLGVIVTAGGACAGVAFHGLPIPLNASICGLSLSAQDAVVCQGAVGFGFGLTNGVCFVISDT